MNWLQFICHAKTIYGVHSPLVYELCTEVLMPRLPHRVSHTLDGRYGRVVYKCSRYYHSPTRRLSPSATLIAAKEPIVVVRRPHANTEAEAYWQQLIAHPRCTVSVDLFDVGLAIASPRLHRQHLLLII